MHEHDHEHDEAGGHIHTGEHDHDHSHEGHDHDHDHEGHDHDHDHGPDRIFSVTVTSPSPTRRVLSIQVPAEEMEKERSRVTGEYRRELRVPGFRKGKVPVGYIQKNYGDVIHNDAVRNVLPAVFEQALHQERLFPLGDPRFDKVELPEGGLSFEAHIEVRPDIELKGYDRLSVEATRREIADGDVDEMVTHLRERMAAYSRVDRPATPDDYAVLDYVPLSAEGEAEEQHRVKDYPVLISSENLLEEFRTALTGAKAGDEKTIAVVYPADFGDSELAGTTRSFQVHVTEIKEKLMPEVDDNFAKRIDPGVASVLELRLRIREQLNAEEEARYQRDIDDKIIDAVLTANPFEVPEVMVQNYLASVIEEDRRQRDRGADNEARDQEIREAYRETAIRTIQRYFVLDAIRRQENLTVTRSEIDERIRAIAVRVGKPEAEIRALMEQGRRRASLESDMLDEKSMAFLRERTAVKAG
ncbi:MAG TPA: trigger factor [Candidatus Krumholzibacteria bacterium]|nr:trigger factor [Candidatus Krumholzibacteria bacterium]